MWLESGVPFMAAISFSKNMGLYRDRVGALIVATESPAGAKALFTHVQRVIRVLYSNPPAHGFLVASAVLGDALLRSMWERELAEMRNRLIQTRAALADALAARWPDRDMSFIRRQKGMYSLLGLTEPQIARLREQYSIYMTADARINIVGITPANLDYVADAIVETVRTVV